MTIQFFVAGHPQAQGSKRHVGKGVMVEMSKDLGPWRYAIAKQAKECALFRRLEGPLKLDATFWFKRPANHYGTGRNAGNLKKTAPTFRESAPDLDKLIRAVGDALVMSGIVPDDRHIVVIQADKRYGDPGVLIAIGPVE